MNSFRGVFRVARDPVVWTNLLAAIVMLAVTFGWHVSPDTQGLINAAAVALAGLVSGWKVATDGGLALVMGFFKAVIALAVAFGLHWSGEQQLVVMAVVAAVGAAFVRTQVSSGVPPTTG
jgi:hypothetical protein